MMNASHLCQLARVRDGAALTTYEFVLIAAHVEGSITRSSRGLDLDVILGSCCMPLIIVQIATANESGCEVTCAIWIDQVCGLPSIPSRHVGVVWMNRDISSDRTLPVCTTPIWQSKLGQEFIYLGEEPQVSRETLCCANTIYLRIIHRQPQPSCHVPVD